MNNIKFDDLLDIRSGDHELYFSGGGDSHIIKLSSGKEWIEKTAALKNIFELTLGIPSPNIDIPLNIKIISEEVCEGYVKRLLEYNVEANERINAYMLIPDNIEKKLPVALCLTPTCKIGMEQTIGNGTSEFDYDRAYALHLVRNGFVTFTFDWDSAGTRQYPGLEPFDNAPFYKKHPLWSAVGKNIWDISKAIDVLSTFREVDSDKIASIGHSQGGGATIYAMAMDTRIKVGISSCGGIPIRMEKNPFNHARNRWWIGRPLLRDFFITGKNVPCDLHELLALCAPRPFLYIAASNDCHYELDESSFVENSLDNMDTNIKNIYSLYNEKNKFSMVLHKEGHSFKNKQRDIAYKWLKDFLL